jgi:hypothetical protein
VPASVAGCGEASRCAVVADAATVRCSAGGGAGTGGGVDNAAAEPGSAPGASAADSVPAASSWAPDVWALDACAGWAAGSGRGTAADSECTVGVAAAPGAACRVSGSPSAD